MDDALVNMVSELPSIVDTIEKVEDSLNAAVVVGGSVKVLDISA